MLAGIALSAVALAGLASHADAHGYLEQPKPSWADSPNPDWVALVDNYWDIGSGGDQCGLFKKMAGEKGMSVKDVVLDMAKGQKCGRTLDNGATQPIPSDGLVKWVGHLGGGFTHVGPCEVYIDDKMVAHGDNCEDEFKGGTGMHEASNIPVDYSTCNGKCTLSIYWLAFQNAQWQAYINCVPLSGSGGGAPATGSGGSVTQTGGSSDTTQSSPATQGSSKDEGQKTTEAPSSEQHSNENQHQSTPAPTQQENNNQDQNNNNNSEDQINQKESRNSDHQDNNQDQNNIIDDNNNQGQIHQDQNKDNNNSNQDLNDQGQNNNNQDQNSNLDQNNNDNDQGLNNQDQNKDDDNNKQEQQNIDDNQDQQQQQQQEQRSHDVNFNILSGGTGTVQPARNLRK